MWRHWPHRTSADQVNSLYTVTAVQLHVWCSHTSAFLALHRCLCVSAVETWRLWSSLCLFCLPPPRVSFLANRTFVIEIELNFKFKLFQKNSWRRFWLFVYPQVKLLGATVEARTSTVETLLRPVMVQTRPVPASLLLLDPVSNSLFFCI